MSSDPDTATTTWEGYSDYESVSKRVAKSVEEAIEAYAFIQSLHSENARVQASRAAEAKARILSAGLRLVPELENDKETVEQYEEILDRWQTDDELNIDAATPDDLGYIRRLDRIALRDECPEWLHQFAIDIRRSAWELGYLQAGRTVSEEEEDLVERDTEALFE